MAGHRGSGRGRGGSRRRVNPAAANRSARVGELVRQIVAEHLESIEDDRLDMVSITSVDVDREMHRAIVWFTTLDNDDDPDVADAFEQHSKQLRRRVAAEAQLRRTPILDFRPDLTLRSAERIESLLRDEEAPDSNGEA